MKLTAEQLQENWDKLIDIVETTFEGERKEKLLEMYELFKDRAMFAPASGVVYYHNAFPGGYVLHVLNITKFALKLYELYKELGLHTVEYNEENITFCTLHHDLGKLGNLEYDYYIPNESEWHRKNQGKIYSHNPNLQYMKVPDRGLWLLQHYGVKVTDKEYLGIKLTDGLYDDANAAYLKGYNPDYNLRSNMAYILHQADMMATHIEFDQWKQVGESSEPINTKVPKTKNEQKQVDNLKQKFDELFA